ncbi:putative disease resistance RPP13-like protein 1 [Alnus glutinosa]|uniref:putative disease resistance RPP13-like protein 1 n=1 Tax=Alnus glutinosa TaxID=3517 RepID=UPI002D7A1EB4|nr:putative disease resistance RPP13-like protein 1 [Alnus glutinosa]XP_062174507.1 putative disease resistance RPP13-like protein 1 [Alnus glutinosa]XP_062174508.1 putative disease resistance RPP13-like protein 1 [Alnus glutinosa]XP_062174509.1 putative disease resistance RPP13-like protein 1 [Alnus glutinosa]XP_062174510.1 putative disease resistance RPP13-like protein 1 [Alnus glutinosa]XP_062174511.1 putative disease resistance RPP13-like protein 1 [Alnus glutinosa]XP_062174512.1 putative
MTEIASIILSPLIKVFFERLASGEFIDFFRRQKLSVGLLKKLKTTFLTLNAVFEDAEELQVTKPAVKEWLEELKDAIYDAEHVLDEIATEALISELDAEFQTTASKVRKLSISAFRNSFVQQIEPKIKEILDRLESLAQQKDLIGLKEGVGGKSSERLPTTSLVEESGICGRNDEKEAIIKMLLSNDVRSDEMCVIAIVGMGGIGKTTLAQSIFNNNKVNDHFNIDAWVCVSEEFDVFKVTKIILETVTSSPCYVTDLNQLQLRLKECLMGKKFLLVLDDVWNENYVHWEELSKPFKFGEQGSRIIVTTRNHNVALVMRASSIHPLKELSEEDCWSLFAKHAFHDGNSNAHGELEVIGRKIIEKCGGLPLAVKTIGALLRSKPDVDEWDKILKSKLWDLSIDEIGILPALRLSYKYLPSYLKRCFAYSSIFPKDYAFKKDQLIMLWTAEGFLQQSENKTMEEVGNEYFVTLESRSLFQKSSDDKLCFVMHDLVSDLAKSISGNFIIRFEGDCSHDIVNNTRHMSYFSKQEFHSLKNFETLQKAKRLRTFLHLDMISFNWPYYYLTKKVVHDLLPILRCLRVLSLSNYQNITELPDSIGKFKYLRYLDLSFTGVKKLPDSICKLYNLQTLILTRCVKLVALPRDMWKLISLRHLDITETGIKEMPIQLGRLKCLQTLTKFIVGKGTGLCIGELGKLTNIRGSLSIFELQNVESPTDVLNASSLRVKKYLEKLVLRWKYENNFSESQRSVLDSLQPHTNLKSLTIQYYGGKSFSGWVGHPSFFNVSFIYLNCKYCSSLPPLGQLPSLQNLSIVGFDEVVRVGHEFCGSGSSSVKPFAALKVLSLEIMPKWEEWVSFGDKNGGGAFPQLEKLNIRECPKLTGELPIHLYSLSKLNIIKCPQLVSPLPLTPTIRELELSNCNEMLLNELPTGMEKLVIKGFNALESLPKGMIDSDCGLRSALKTLCIFECKKLELSTHLDYSSLEKLCLWNCGSLKSFPLDLFPKLYHIEIYRCTNLESLTVPKHYEHDLVTLHIDISSCPNFESFPRGGLCAPDLTSLSINYCKNLKSLPEKMHILLLSLQHLRIKYCLEVESFPEGGLPSNLNSIDIMGCDKLIASWMGWGLQNLPILKHLSIGGKNEDLESFPEAQLLPTSLTSLSVEDFPNLKCLDKKGLQHLIALEELHIWSCPKLKFMPEQGLPASLSILRIRNCPLLKKERQSKKGKKWRKIAHVEQIWIDDELIE